MKILEATHWTTAAKLSQVPESALPEFAFLGRSNVGKSTLINCLVNRKRLARTSSTPGKTRQIQFFQIAVPQAEFVFADLPGYGYAKVARSERVSWQKLIEGYLATRECLRVAVLLQDLRRDVSEDETLLLDWLAERGVFTVVAITKADKLKPMRRAKRLRELREALALPKERVIPTSAQTGMGIDELWKVLLDQRDQKEPR